MSNRGLRHPLWNSAASPRLAVRFVRSPSSPGVHESHESQDSPGPRPSPRRPELRLSMLNQIVAAPERPTPSTETQAFPSPEAPGRPSAGSAITRRAILLGLALIPPNVYWVGM